MLDERAAIAPRPASAQLGVELFEHQGAHSPNGQMSERGPHVDAGVTLVGPPRRLLNFVHPNHASNAVPNDALVRALHRAFTCACNRVRILRASRSFVLDPVR